MTTLVRPEVQPAPAPAAPRSGAGAVVALAVAVGMLVLGVLVASLLVGGAAPRPAASGLPDAGAVVGWGQPVVTLLSRLLAVLVVGSLLVAAVLRPAPGGVLPDGSRRAVLSAAAAAFGWAAAQVTGLVLLTGSLTGQPATGVALADVVAVATTLPVGRTVLAVVLLLLVVAAGAARATRARDARLLLLVALAAVVLPLLTSGHPAAAADHVLTVTVLAVHVVAASLWTGGLLGVLLHLRGAGPDRVTAVGRLSRLALACVVAVTGTGVLGGLLLTDAPLAAVLTSGYGALLLAKTAAVVLLVVLGWLHRRRTLPLLRAGRRGAFVRLAVVEAVLMGATLAVAVGLSSAPPPAGTEPAPAPAPAPAQAGDLDHATPPLPGGPVLEATDAEPAAPAAEDMSGHDHGELSVAVLVDDERLHLGDPVRPGASVTVYNSGSASVVLRSEEGGVDTVVPSRTFVTFPAPATPGSYPLGDPADPRYADVLQVLPAD